MREKRRLPKDEGKAKRASKVHIEVKTERVVSVPLFSKKLESVWGTLTSVAN